MRDEILVYGTVCLDRLRKVDALPKKGGYVPVREELFALGGEAANTAFALKKWGAPVRLMGNPIGRDPMGEVLWGLIEQAGLPRDSMPDIADWPTPVCDIYVTPDGDRTMFGQNFNGLTENPMGALPVERAAWFTADPNLGEIAAEACLEAAQGGAKLLAQDFLRRPEVARAAEIWLCSTDWVGFAGDTPSLKAWTSQWAVEYGTLSIVTDGERGGVVAFPNGAARAFPAYTAPRIVDTTGSGDLFRAGLLFGLWREWELDDCLRFACAAACLNAGELGAIGGVRSVTEIEDFMRSQPWSV